MPSAEFAFAIEFLGPVMLADPFRPDLPEWPPSPSRVYAALIAAACEHRLGDAVLAALCELEGQAPAITAPAASAYSPHRLAVPTAHTVRGMALMAEPELSLDSPFVAYHWRVPAAAVDGIAAAVRCLSHVGRAESLVLGHVYAPGDAPPPNWLPDPDGQQRLRVPTPGRFQVLERDYQRGRVCVVVEPTVAYRRVGEAAAPAATGPWGEWIALRVAHGDIRSAALLASGLRAAVLSILGDDAHPQIHGHGQHEHVAWLALPHVGEPHGDGRVLGVAALPPRDFDAEAGRQLRHALAQVREIPLRGGRVAVGLPTRTAAALEQANW
ncbi:MAG: type I-U CRISPR-associated protein Csb2, partial [Candidatus Methylumidiphilus sp.]